MDLDVTGLFYKQENCELEYKQGYNVEDIAQSMAAFATSGGGYILLGVKPDGSPAGFATPSEDEMRNNLYSIAKQVIGGRISIDVGFHPYDRDKKIVIIRIDEGFDKPYGWKGVFYRRVDASDEKLNPDEITKIRLESHQQSFDALPGRVYGRPANPGDINEAEVKRYIQEIGEGKRSRVMTYSDVVSALKNFDLVSGDRSVKNAALLLFGNKPQDAFPQSRINFLIYEGDVIADNALKLKRVIEGSIIKQIKEAFQLIRANTENRIAMDGLRRIEIDQYPSNAIREAIINAAAHRDYLISGADITIKLFGNRLEITNPGQLMKGVTMDQLKKGGHPSSRRNPLICRMLDNLGYMEQSGQGIKSMIEAMRKYGLEEPKISLVDDFFKIEFVGQKVQSGAQTKTILGTSTNLEPLLTPKEKGFLSQVLKEENDLVTITEYMKKTGTKSRITAKKHLDKFEKFGLFTSSIRGKERVYSRKITNV